MAKPRTNARTDDDPRVEALALDVSAPTPLYLQLATKLTDAIRGGQWKAGEALPAERQLCERLQISRVTLRQAVDVLVEQCLVSRRQGAGTLSPRRSSTSSAGWPVSAKRCASGL